jgi:hypothetical protein
MGAPSTGVLSSDRLKAIDVIVAGGDDTAAAEAAGVTPRTIRRWKGEPAFADAIIRAQDEMLEKVSVDLARTAKYAVGVLRMFLADAAMKPQIRLRAAEILLNSTLRWRELRDIERRLAALEAVTHAGD